ncbi:hypothetical protein AA103581_0067 [Gluconobacter wancherniae NBRC 103581]|nr:hypothetical protein AA103581_0067 [Gluconobacter wancherniae NBRC 103581]
MPQDRTDPLTKLGNSFLIRMQNVSQIIQNNDAARKRVNGQRTDLKWQRVTRLKNIALTPKTYQADTSQ